MADISADKKGEYTCVLNFALPISLAVQVEIMGIFKDYFCQWIILKKKIDVYIPISLRLQLFDGYYR